MSPTDTFIQHAAQQMGGSGLAVAILIALSALVIAIAVCLIGLWREIRREDERLQHNLERSESRARGER